MRKINIIKTVNAVTFASSLLLASCTGNFDDLNTHPTDVYDDQMTEIEKVGSVFPVMTYLLNPQQENNSQMTEQMVGCRGPAAGRCGPVRLSNQSFPAASPERQRHHPYF